MYDIIIRCFSDPPTFILQPEPVLDSCAGSMLSESMFQGRAVRDMQRGPDHPEGEYIYIYIYIYISDFWTSQPEQVLTFSFGKCH